MLEMEAESEEAKKIGSKRPCFNFCFLPSMPQYDKAIEESQHFLGSKKIVESLDI